MDMTVMNIFAILNVMIVVRNGLFDKWKARDNNYKIIEGVTKLNVWRR